LLKDCRLRALMVDIEDAIIKGPVVLPVER
jgi:hypothetical protein